jgi:hypothetical protein
MNRIERDFSAQGEAKLKYLPGEYKVTSPGTFVVCAVTGKRILLENLRYWSVERQEAYSSSEVSLSREQGKE